MGILGVYRSKATSATTYHSYFVVNKQKFNEVLDRDAVKLPNLAELKEYLKRLKATHARFIYHSRFGTSSYFLPALHFRREGIFKLENQTGDLIGIDARPVEPPTDSAQELVRKVAEGNAEVAAVGDGVKMKFEAEGQFAAEGDRVYFIRLSSPLPNDLLVYSPGLRIQPLPDAGVPIHRGDFWEWKDIGQ